MNLFRLKTALLSLLLFVQLPSRPATPFNHFRYQRNISSASSLASAPSGTQACAILDAEVFAHAASTLKDLRLYGGSVEVPYTTTVVEPQQQDSDDARILNRRTLHGRIVFDLEMPRRPYTSFTLDLSARDFVATAIVSGRNDLTIKNAGIATLLGTFTLFDLTSQHLFKSTSISLPESAFPFLHVELALFPVSGNPSAPATLNLPSVIRSASVPPSREAQSLYTGIQAASSMLQSGNESVATFRVPARVPVERVHFILPRDHKESFSRSVTIEARGISDGSEAQDDPDSSDSFGYENAAGTILSVHRSEAGHAISVDDLDVPVAIGSNMQQPATIHVRVEKGEGPSIPLSVQLQMRQRQICFDAASAKAPLTLYYGDSSLDAPAYSSTPMRGTVAPRLVDLGPEALNPAFAAAASSHRLVGQRPILRWIALLGCVCVFALLVIRSTNKRRR